MANRKVNITIETTANTSGAKQAEKAMDGLAQSANRVSTAGQAAGKSASRVGQLAGQAGFQVQDFAVQVGAGTSALTAFSQQAPQLLGAFGPAGAIAGAVVAIGAIAAKVFLGMGDNAEEAGKRATEAGEKMLEAFEKAGGQKADEFIRKLGEQTKLTDILRESAIALIETQNSKIRSDAELAKSQSLATEEALKYLEATGQIKSAEEAIIALRKQTAGVEKEAAIAEIQAGVETERLRYEAIREQKKDVLSDVDAAQKRIDELQSREQSLIKKLGFAQSMDKASDKGAGFKSTETRQAEAQLAEIENQIKGLFGFIDQAPEKIGALTASAYAQGAVIDNALAQAQIATEAIESQFDITGKTEAIKAATTAIGEGAKTIGEEIAKLEPIGAIQEEAKAKVSAAVADGIITAQEQREIGSSLQTLMGTLKTGQGATLTSLQDLISLNNELVSKVAAQNVAIVNMRARINSLALPVR
jgi:hypothetical protein